MSRNSRLPFAQITSICQKKQPQKPTTSIKDGIEEMDNEFPFNNFFYWNILTRKTGVPFKQFRFPRKFSPGTTRSGVPFTFQSDFLEKFVNGKQPIFSVTLLFQVTIAFSTELRSRFENATPNFCLCSVHYWVSCAINKGGFFEIAFVSTHICLALRRLLTFCLTLTR